MSDERCKDGEHAWGPLEVIGGYGFVYPDDTVKTGEMRGYICRKCDEHLYLGEDLEKRELAQEAWIHVKNKELS